MRQIKINIKPKVSRLDKYLSTTSKLLTRSQAKKLIKSGHIHVNEQVVDPSYELKKGDSIKIEIPAPKPTEILPEDIPLNVIFEDSDLLVVDKEAGMVVHPTMDYPTGTLVNALLYHLRNKKLPEGSESLRPGIVHRLDKDTSGLLVIAKNQETLEKLKKQFKERRVEKKYLALVAGKLEPKSGKINKPIGRHPKNRKKFTAVATGKESETYYRVEEYLGDKFSLVEVEPKTGRTHQIRVHLSSIGHPIVGDTLYGGKAAPRMFLHAASLEFVHPQEKKKLTFESNLPAKLQEMLAKYKSRL